MTRTFARLAASVALGAGFGAALLHAPAAHADSYSFLDEIHDQGWYSRESGDSGLLNQGYAVCRALASGMDGATVAGIIYRSTGVSVSAADAVGFVIVAVENLCPEFDHRNQGAVA